MFSHSEPLVRFYIVAAITLVVAGIAGYLHDFRNSLLVSGIAVIAATFAYLGLKTDGEAISDTDKWLLLQQSLLQESGSTVKRPVRRLHNTRVGSHAIINPEFRFEYVPQYRGTRRFAVVYLYGKLDTDRWIELTEPLIEATARQQHGSWSDVLLFDLNGIRSVNEQSVRLFYHVQEKAPDYGVAVGFVSSSRRNESVVAQMRHTGLQIYGSIGSALAGISEAQA